MAKKKKEKFPYKFLRPDELDDLHRLTTEELLKMHLAEGRALKALKKQRKDDTQIRDLDNQIKEHREQALTDEMKHEIEEAKAVIKAIKEQIDEPITEILEDRKALKKGWNDALKPHAEKMDVILKIIDGR